MSAAEADDASAAEPSRKSPCAEEADDCRDALERLRADRLADIDLDIRVRRPARQRLPLRMPTRGGDVPAAAVRHDDLHLEGGRLLPQAAVLRGLGAGAVRPLATAAGRPVPLRRPLLHHAPRAALQDGRRIAVGVRLSARLLPPGQLCPVDGAGRSRSAAAASPSRRPPSPDSCSCFRSFDMCRV